MVDRNDYDSTPSRFERLIVQTSFLDEIIASKKRTTGTNEALRTIVRKHAVNVKGSLRSDPMFSGTLLFAPAFTDSDNTHGTPWVPVLVKPKAGKDYYVSCNISQLQNDGPTSQLQGFKTIWTLAEGWSWVDGKGSTIYSESISNPLYIRRVARCPSSPKSRGFKVIVDIAYRP